MDKHTKKILKKKIKTLYIILLIFIMFQLIGVIL